MTHPSDYSPLGLVLKSYRVRRGWSQLIFACQAEVALITVAQVESGVRNPTFNTLEKLLSHLGVSWSEFGRDMDAVTHEQHLIAR